MLFSVQDIVDIVRGHIENKTEIQGRIEELRVGRPAELRIAGPSHLAYFFSRSFENDLPLSNPGILITAPSFVQPLRQSGLPLWKTAAVISVKDPYFAMAVLSEKFAKHFSSVAHVPSHEAEDQGNQLSAEPAEVHPTAVISQGVKIGRGVRIGAFCVIEEGAVIEDRAVLYSGCMIGPGCHIGSESVLFPRVTLYENVVLGRRVRIHSGSVIGSDGFGYAPVKVNGRVSHHQKIYHLGTVVIEDDVEIGANSCVDRATLGETRIGKGAKLDNVVHIGHNARLDEGAIICGGTCLAGNATVGKFAYVGGLTGIGNHVHVGDGANVGALAMVTKDVPAGGTAVGNPQREYREHFRAHALLNKLLLDRRSKENG
ncbi:MAG: UDP-3-O-(3-hydroxymyristoyl)glucosamine N-acyltransferase [Bdellovibrio sp.]|nr:UDP-3-O-(3-hydroxymyristoyl)glucosamine N-acyltransferase [Bdellovibrio sp.]